LNWKNVIKNIADVIYPPMCLGCLEILHPEKGKYFCANCQEQIRYLTDSMCPVCGISFFNSSAGNHLCGNCLYSSPFFSIARAVAVYETIILNIIHKFKYGRDLSIGSALASFLANFSFPDFEFQSYSLLIPVPLHIKKLRERGFNQSLILAYALGEKKQIDVNFSLLKRHKFTLTQTGLNKKEREQNIKGAFEVSDKKKIAGKNIILIDDVYTTGSTLNECAKTLLKAGAEQVAALTLARVL
jgi:ComF family protein